MGFLGVLGSGAEYARLLRQVFFTKIGVDQIAASGDRVLTQGHAVGSHIGDQAGGLAVDFDAFIEALGDSHGLGRAETELAGSFLLQGRGGERRLRVALGAFLLNRCNFERCRFDVVLGSCCGALIGEIEAFELLPVPFDEAAFEGGALGTVEADLDGPVFAGLEDFDFSFAFANQAQCDRLHAPGGAGTRQLTP